LGEAMTFRGDGEDTLRQLKVHMSPQSKHILDSLRIAMKLPKINQP
jgi:hypothetical protein